MSRLTEHKAYKDRLTQVVWVSLWSKKAMGAAPLSLQLTPVVHSDSIRCNGQKQNRFANREGITLAVIVAVGFLFFTPISRVVSEAS